MAISLHATFLIITVAYMHMEQVYGHDLLFGFEDTSNENDVKSTNIISCHDMM